MIEKKYISRGRGFISRVYKISVTFEDDFLFNFVVKIPGLESVIEAFKDLNIHKESNKEKELQGLHLLSKVHNIEVYFYNHFSKIKNLNLFKCYGTLEWIVNEQAGAIVMEYAGEEGSNFCIHESMTFEQANNLLDQLLNLQSHFFALPDAEWITKFPRPFGIENMSSMIGMLGQNYDLIKSFIPQSNWIDIDTDIRALIVNFKDICRYNSGKLMESEGNCLAMQLGDSWCNNIMYKSRQDKEIYLVDFQLFHAGNITEDITRAILTSCSPDIRHSIEKESLFKFHQELVAKASKNEIKFDMSWETFKNNYDSNFIEQSIQFLILIAFTVYSVRTDSLEQIKLNNDAIGQKVINGLRDAITLCKKDYPQWLIIN
uniref:CHK domain-containing protein n=1 Tax=Rhabditophanes sp. KR3021 TaxID=114890 RepID=A0AC35TXC9_9BILA